MVGDVLIKVKFITSTGNMCITTLYKFRHVSMADVADVIETLHIT